MRYHILMNTKEKVAGLLRLRSSQIRVHLLYDKVSELFGRDISDNCLYLNVRTLCFDMCDNGVRVREFHGTNLRVLTCCNTYVGLFEAQPWDENDWLQVLTRLDKIVFDYNRMYKTDVDVLQDHLDKLLKPVRHGCTILGASGEMYMIHKAWSEIF